MLGPHYAVPYFNRPYTDTDYIDPEDDLSVSRRIIDGEGYVIFRKNHGISHSLRQYLLALKIIFIIQREDDPFNPLTQWVKDEISDDPSFALKVATVSSFQRSGRGSEIPSSQDPKRYKEYEFKDVCNFLEAVPDSLFCCWNEKVKYSKALSWSDDSNISKILRAAHTLDLRRIFSFDQNRILDETRKHLCYPREHVIQDLWETSGLYLDVTGDRDLMKGKYWYSNRFYILQQNPKDLFCLIQAKDEQTARIEISSS